MKIDAHQHFWAYDAAQYPWIPPGSPLHRNWLPGDLRPLLEAHGISGCVAVQARQSIEESRWLLRLADEAEIIKGVVGWVDLRSSSVEAKLAELTQHPKFVGVRHVVQDEPDDRFLLQAEFVRGLEKLAAYDLAYDLLIYPRQLPAAIELVQRLPAQRFVLDHIAKPPIAATTLEPWRTQIRELALSSNVMCKVSGFITEADHRAWKAADFAPYLDTVFEAFGEDRLLFGSDWPVCLFAASYAQVCEVMSDYAGALAPEAQAKLWGGNAARFYRLA
jgi:L-fuconolactonase